MRFDESIQQARRLYHSIPILGSTGDKLSDLKDINAKKGNFIAIVNWFVGNLRSKVPIERYI